MERWTEAAPTVASRTGQWSHGGTRGGGGSARDLGRKLAFPGLRGPLSLVVLLAMVGLLFLPESWRMATTLAVDGLFLVAALLAPLSSGLI